ncbi:MAG: hypothetical protein UT47_C0004G0076 [candidate division CPR2 bacterium GW2011_GWC2_39_35]|nr:MAG: hypothetical protein UT47_C0004G0076 [candidate division CPR2 bacterium GW2011_GWC2_39_35]
MQVFFLSNQTNLFPRYPLNVKKVHLSLYTRDKKCYNYWLSKDRNLHMLAPVVSPEMKGSGRNGDQEYIGMGQV